MRGMLSFEQKHPFQVGFFGFYFEPRVWTSKSFGAVSWVLLSEDHDSYHLNPLPVVIQTLLSTTQHFLEGHGT